MQSVLSSVPYDEWLEAKHIEHVELPEDCFVLPESTQSALKKLMYALQNAQWLTHQKDEHVAQALLSVHQQRVQNHTSSTLELPVQYEEGVLESLIFRWVSAKTLERSAYQAAGEILQKDPRQLQTAGRSAWDALVDLAATTPQSVSWNGARIQSRDAVRRILEGCPKKVIWEATQAAVSAAEQSHPHCEATHWVQRRAQDTLVHQKLDDTAALIIDVMRGVARHSLHQAFVPVTERMLQALQWPSDWERTWNMMWYSIRDIVRDTVRSTLRRAAEKELNASWREYVHEAVWMDIMTLSMQPKMDTLFTPIEAVLVHAVQDAAWPSVREDIGVSMQMYARQVWMEQLVGAVVEIGHSMIWESTVDLSTDAMWNAVWNTQWPTWSTDVQKHCMQAVSDTIRTVVADSVQMLSVDVLRLISREVEWLCAEPSLEQLSPFAPLLSIWMSGWGLILQIDGTYMVYTLQEHSASTDPLEDSE